MKMSVQISLFLVAFNAFGAVLLQSGVAADLGIVVQQQDTGVIEQALVENVDLGGTGIENTLFGMYNRLSQQLSSLLWTITPGFQMLKGYLPNLWVDFVLLPISSIVVGKDLIAFARGTDL